jgi:prophage tail gpP-like protein
MTNPLTAAMMPTAGRDLCQVFCNGRIFEGWTDIAVSRSVQDMAGRFRLAITEPVNGAGKVLGWQIRPGDPIRVKLGGVQVLDGFVDVRQAGYYAESHGVEIQGRSKTAAAIEAAAVTEDGAPAGPFADYTLDEIARSLLAPYGVGLKVIGDIGGPFASVSAQVGESVFEVLERLARLRGFHLYDNAEGELVLANKTEDSAPIGLVEGVNILAATATIDLSQTPSELFVFGQATGNDDAFGVDVANQKAVAKNSGMPLPVPRPKVIVLEAPGDQEDMKARANREMAQEAAKQTTAQVTVQGWLTGDGDLWDIGMTVKLTSPMLLVDRDMMVAAVEFLQSDGSGTVTNLDLITPEAFAEAAAQPMAPVPSTEDGNDQDTNDADDVEDTSLSAALWNPRAPEAAA